MNEKTPLLIVGAGPFGLSLAAYLKQRNVEHLQVGCSMDYWKDHMPRGMYLRSACDWHLDALDDATIMAYLEEQNLTPRDVEPLTLDFYLGYADWFRSRKGLAPRPAWVEKLSRTGDSFIAAMNDGSEIEAGSVVLAVGLRYFKNLPEDYRTLFPGHSVHHTAELTDFAGLRNKRILILGGRQSAFEWAALSHEQGAADVHLTYRHDTPDFVPSDWQWVNPILQEMVGNPAWFRTLSPEEKDRVGKRMWSEGRLKLEPWLAKRVVVDGVAMHPRTHVTGCVEKSSGELQITLSDQTELAIDEVILATGYTMDIARIPLLAGGNLLDRIGIRNGFPVLDEGFQSTIPNLYFTGFPAAQDFGPFFGFTAAVRTSALVIGRQFE